MWVRASWVTCAWAAIWPASRALMCRRAVSLDACWKLASAMSRFAPQVKSVTDRLGPRRLFDGPGRHDLDDLPEMYQRLKAKGFPIHVADHTISLGVYFSDPDGNGLEVYYELPRSQWNRERPFSEQGEKGRFPGPWDEMLSQSAPAVART